MMTEEKEQNGMSKGPKRVSLNTDELSSMSKDEIYQKWKSQEEYIEYLEEKLDASQSLKHETSQVKQIEEKLRRQVTESSRKENMLLMRLTQKETENHELATQVQELKDNRTSANQQLRMMLLDPAVNVMFERMKKELQDCKKKLEQTQNDLSAWKFTPDSQTGKRLMARIRLLLQENEELGKMIHSGRTAKLESEIALEKKLVQEMKKSQAEFDEFLVEIDEETEGMQSTIYILQQQLKEAREVIQHLTQELEPVKPGVAVSILNRVRLEGSSNVSKDMKTESANSTSVSDAGGVTTCPETMNLDRGPSSDSNFLVKHEAMDVDDESNNRKVPTQHLASSIVNGAESDSGESPRTNNWADGDSNTGIEARTTHRAGVSRSDYDSPPYRPVTLTSESLSLRTGSKNSSSSS